MQCEKKPWRGSRLPQHPLSNEASTFALLANLSFQERLDVLPTLSREWRALLNDEAFHKWLCERLHHERRLYIPPRLPPGTSWKRIFEDLWPLREMWTCQDMPLPSQNRYNMHVVARFRPKNQVQKDSDENTDMGNRFFLPLHQKLQLIRARDKCSERNALTTLKREGGWFGADWKKGSTSNPADSTTGALLHPHIHTIDSGTARVVAMAPGVGLREFDFDHVLDVHVNQGNVYEASARQLVTDFLNGFNATVMVYGQTGSGKTFTMFGDPESYLVSPSSIESQESTQEGTQAAAAEPELPSLTFNPTAKLCGVVPRAVKDVLEAVKRKNEQNIQSDLYVSYVQVYGDQVLDLLNQGGLCGQSKVAAQRYVLNGAARRPVHSMEEVSQLLTIGESQKRKAATAMNESSSRAHTLFIMTLESRDPAVDKVSSSQLFLVDLGGSEQVKKSEVHHGTMTNQGHVLGVHMREAVYINLGLLALKKCIVNLNKGRTYVPYQDSKLTMLLSPALGGGSKAAVVVCGATETVNAKETIQALRFGEACSQVETNAKIGARGAAALLQDIEDKIANLEDEIKVKERWENVQVVREDTHVESGTFEAALVSQRGGEVLNIGRVTGAEAERSELEKLIVKRCELLGEDPELKLAEAGFGNQFAKGTLSAMGGHAEGRFAETTEGLKIKGQVVSTWSS